MILDNVLGVGIYFDYQLHIQDRNQVWFYKWICKMAQPMKIGRY